MTTPTHERNRRIVASAGFGVFQRLIQVASTFVIMPLMLRTLGPALFGIWGAVTSLAWISGLVDIGTGSALVTLVARSLAHNRPAEARTHITGGLIIGSCLSLLMLIVAVVIRMSGVLQNNADAYLISLVGLALNIPLSTANSVWMALQKGYTSGFWELVQTILTTVGLICASFFTKDVRVYVAVVYGGLVLANLGSLIHLFFLHPELRPQSLPESLMSIWEVAGSGIMFFILNITAGAAYMFDNVLALQLLGPEASASMTIVMRICMTAFGMLAVLAQPLWPAFTDAAHKSDRGWVRRALLRGTALLVSATAIGSIVLVLYGEFLLRVWLHASLGIGKILLLAISAWVLSQALVRVPVLLLNALSFIRFQIVIAIVVTLISFIGKFLLAPRLGIAGILWSTSIAVFLISAPAYIWRIYRWADRSAKQEIFSAD